MQKQIYRLKGIAAGAGLLLLSAPLSSAFALTVTSPGSVLMIDGVGDSNTTVQITALDASFPISQYEFGFLSGSSFTSITSTIDWSYTFNGGDVVDFALREIASNTIYDIANAADYANQTYSLPIDPSYSQNPVVTSPYYHGLTISWDLNHDGYTDPGFDFAVTPLLSNDGMAPTVVPLPAAAWLFGSGLFGLGALARRRRPF
jgi:hypothetical protein